MKTDLANRTGQHNYTIDLNSEVLSSSADPTPTPQASTAHAMANNPLYVVNYSKPDKVVNITRDKFNLEKNASVASENVYQEPADAWGNVRD